MAYTPELSLKGSATLRRLAWYMGKPMTRTLGIILESAAKGIKENRPGAVCLACKDKSKCADCVFEPNTQTTEN